MCFPSFPSKAALHGPPKKTKNKQTNKQALATGGGFESVACEHGDSFGKD